jgi:hypothetical protein
MKYLESPKQIMEAFLSGKKLQNDEYQGIDYYLYLDMDTGFICEEDGAGAKAHRAPMCMRNDEKWWVYEE